MLSEAVALLVIAHLAVFVFWVCLPAGIGWACALFGYSVFLFCFVFGFLLKNPIAAIFSVTARCFVNMILRRLIGSARSVQTPSRTSHRTAANK